MAKKIHSAGEAQTNGITDHESPLTGSGPDFAMIFNLRDIADVDIPELSFPTAGKSQNGKRIQHIPGPFQCPQCWLSCKNNFFFTEVRLLLTRSWPYLSHIYPATF